MRLIPSEPDFTPMPGNLSATLKTVENKLRRDSNMSGQIDYNEQIAWMLFLKALDQIEHEQEDAATFKGVSHATILDRAYRWTVWVKVSDTAEQKLGFVKNKLFPYLRSLSGSPVRNLIAQIFDGIPTKLMSSAVGMAEVLDLIDAINLNSNDDTHHLSQFYEESLLKMGGQGRQAGGEFYTPRPVIRLILKIIDPKVGETVLDPFLGSGGFLAEAFSYMKAKQQLKATEFQQLQEETFFGQELKPIPFLLGTMNCILHGLYGANLKHVNTFANNIRHLPPSEKVDVIVTNPPFGAEVEPSLRVNFPYPTSASTVLGVQYILRRLKQGGRCGMVVDEGFLFGADKAATQTKKELLEENNLFAIVSLPQGVFTGVGTGVKTNLIFFEKGGKTKDVWRYDLAGKFSKTKPIKDVDTNDCWNKYQDRIVSENSWRISLEQIVERNYNLDFKNPNSQIAAEQKTPAELLTKIEKSEEDISKIIKQINADLVG